MRDKDLYAQILGIVSPWHVREVDLRLAQGEVEVRLERDATVPLACPTCGAAAPGYDSRERRWRHLDTCQYRTILVADVPRVNCAEHGVHQIQLPWSEPGSRFTALFEALVIDWLQEANLSAVGRLMGLSWAEVEGIVGRAVKRGLARRQPLQPGHLSVDETSFAKRYEYVTVVRDGESGHVVHVADGRGLDSLDSFYATLSDSQKEQITSVSMDMWGPYISSTLAHVPDAERKIAFDKFHIAKHLGVAVDQVRCQEHRELRAVGRDDLKGTKHLWLRNPQKMARPLWQSFRSLRQSTLRTARAWALRQAAMCAWDYQSRGWAARAWTAWLKWAQRCRLAPMVRAGQMIRRHLWGIINAIVLKVTNGPLEAINGRIQKLKREACGYRNRERFRRMILFRLGGLHLYPDGVGRSGGGQLAYVTHTKP